MTATPLQESVASPSQAGERSAERSALQDFVKCFFRELTAYSREVFLYPEQHPRLVARTQSLGETVVSFVSSRDSALYFQVREGTLFSGNEAVDTGDEAAPQLAAFLQERMVQLVCILPQATAEEVLELVRFLIDPERVACSGIEGLRKIDLGANIVLYRFPRKFSESGSPVSEEEIVAQAELGDAEAEDVGLDGEEWLRFSKEQLQSVREILRSPQVRRRLSNILDSAGEVCAKESGDAGGDVDGGGDRSGHGRGEGDGDREGDGEGSSEIAGHEVSAGFVPCFFELLRSDPRINWKDSEQLLRSVEASLDLLEKAKSFKESEQGVPLHLLHVPRGQPDLLGEDFRWQLLRNFAPRDFLPEPRAAVDLATPAEPGARAEAGLQGGWQAPDLAFLREEFADFFERKRFLCEYAATATHLVNQRDEAETETAKHYFATLQDAFAEKPAWPAMIQSLLYFTSHLPKAIRLRWQVKTLRLLARPADVLQVLSGLDGISLDEHLRSPPLPLSRQMPVDGTPLSMHQELLRQLLCLADDYALDVVFFLLSGPHLKLAAKHGWSDLFVEIAGLHRSIRSWIARRAREHCHAAAFFALASLPLHCVKDGLMSGFKEGGEDEQLGFVSVFERLNSAVAMRMLSVALEFPSVKARQAALEMMGRHDNPYAFKTLLSILKERNKGASNAYEANIICNALALHQGEEGRASLRKIVSDVKSLLGIGWRKGIRQAARMALNEWKSREPESHG